MFRRFADRIRPMLKSAHLQTATQRINSVLDSPRFFYWLIGIFIFQSLWIALSARYPQAFDENFHFGLIQLHAKQWLPFFTSQPVNAEVYGAVSRDPSYFYHYLMSLPYRLLTHVTHIFALQIIILRLINIAMFVWGLFVYRLLFNVMGVSRRLRNVVLLFFVLTPIVPLLASQINYDNLVFPLTGLMFLYTVRYLMVLRRERQIHTQLLLELILYGLVAGIVKYTSLPLFAAVLALIAFYTIKVIGHRTESLKQAFTASKKWVLILYAVLLLIFGGLFVERYAINIMRYHTPSPDCAVVLTDELCEAYSPWARDHLWSQILPNPKPQGIAVYPFVWFHRMVWETMFFIGSLYGDDGVIYYLPAPPLTVANYTAWAIVMVGFVLLALFIRKLWRMTYLRVLLLAIAFYAVLLFLKNFSGYLYSGEAVAIHGRYLVPMYPILYLMLALGFGWLLQRYHKSFLKPLVAVVVVLPFLQGAGLIGWIYRSNPAWYWSQDVHSPVYRINHPVQNVVHRIFIP